MCLATQASAHFFARRGRRGQLCAAAGLLPRRLLPPSPVHLASQTPGPARSAAAGARSCRQMADGMPRGAPAPRSYLLALSVATVVIASQLEAGDSSLQRLEVSREQLGSLEDIQETLLIRVCLPPCATGNRCHSNAGTRERPCMSHQGHSAGGWPGAQAGPAMPCTSAGYTFQYSERFRRSIRNYAPPLSMTPTPQD